VGGDAAPVRRAVTPARVRVLDDGRARTRDDVLATEEPLEIRLAAGDGETRTVAVTMRTPGADFELAAGFLHTEGVIAGQGAVRRIDYCVDPVHPDQHYNVVTVSLAADHLPELSTLDRYGTVSSACGVCGKASLEALRVRGVAPAPSGRPAVAMDMVYGLPDALRAAQGNFSKTGGLHGAGLFSAADGDPLVVREDVGRHNTVDKVVGWALLKNRLATLEQSVLVVSGRAGFEIVQKAAAARIPIVCAVSAPSSLAVAVAEELGLTLVGFLRGRRANVYAGADRLR
jgi:FdhD protein